MLNVVEVPVGELIPYENNPRRIERAVPKVMRSIQELGFYNPIQITRDKVVINGHTRLAAAKRLGMQSVPCIYQDDLTDEQARAMRLIDNRTGEFAQWDEAREREELERILGMDMSEFGFELKDEDLDDLDDGGEPSEPEPKREVPDYEPKESQWLPADLASADHDALEMARLLVADVEDDDLRAVLEARLGYLYRWDYERIADYHAYQATPAARAAMEALGMVFLDEAGQVANGFSSVVDEGVAR